MLILGTDLDAERISRGKSGLTDAITVISVAADGNGIAIFSLPRDSTDVPMPNGSTWTRKINALVALNGVESMRDTMSLLFGLQIDHYLLLNMDDFRHVVDAVGGVDVSVPYTLADNRCTIQPGMRHLDGALALCFARHRASDSDYKRAERHQQLLLAIRDKLLAGDLDLQALSGSLRSLQTDIELSNIPAYAELLSGSASAAIHQLVLAPPTYTTFAGMTDNRGWISIPDIAAIRAAIAGLLGS